MAESVELAMIAEKARALLNRSERQMLGRCCTAYATGQIRVKQFVDSLVRLLSSPDKATFLVELRELVREEDQTEYDYRVFALRQPFRAVQFQSNNCLDFEVESSDPHQRLLQVDRHCPHVTSDTRRAFNKQPKVSQPFTNGLSETLFVRQGVTCDGNRTSHVRGLHETKLQLMTPDIASAFPTAAFNPQSQSAIAAQESCGFQPTGQSVKQQRTISRKPRRRGHPPCSGDDELIEVVIVKTKNLLGIAIEGGHNTRHPLPRIIGIDGKGTAFEAAGLKIGQSIVEVDGIKMEGLSHSEAASLIAKSYANQSVPELKLVLTASAFRPNANYQPEN